MIICFSYHTNEKRNLHNTACNLLLNILLIHFLSKKKLIKMNRIIETYKIHTTERNQISFTTYCKVNYYNTVKHIRKTHISILC